MQQVAFFTFHDKTVFVPLKYIYPECFVLIEPYEQVSPLQCIYDDQCPANRGCMEILAKRINYFFTHVTPKAELLITYFKYRDRPNSIRAGVFDRELNEPRVMTLNQSAFRKFQREGLSFTWIPTNEFLFMGASNTLIPVENLIVKPHGTS